MSLSQTTRVKQSTNRRRILLTLISLSFTMSIQPSIANTSPLMNKEDMNEYRYPNNINKVDERGRTALIVAAYEGQFDTVSELVRKGADINIQDRDGWSALLSSKTANVARFLIQNGADIHTVSNTQINALMMAANIGDKDLVSYLMKRKVNINLQSKSGRSSLMFAIPSRNLELISYIIDNGGNVNAQTTHGWSPLMMAVERGELDMANYFIDNGADVNALNKNGWGVLEVAAYNNHLGVLEEMISITTQNKLTCEMREKLTLISIENGAVDVLRYLLTDKKIEKEYIQELFLHALTSSQLPSVEYLISKGADANKSFTWIGTPNTTPLMVSSRKGDIDTVKYLLKRGLDVNSIDSNGWTALMYAVIEGDMGIVRNLVNEGADLNAKAMSGESIMSRIVAKNDPLIFQYFLENGVNVNAVDKSGRGVLYDVSWFGKLDYVKALVEHGAKINAEDINIAAANGHIEVVSFLIDSVPKNFFNKVDFASFLDSAASTGNLNVVRYLVERGVDINSLSGMHERSAMMIASQYRFIDIIDYLIKAGGDVNLINKYGKTALMYAVNPLQGAGYKDEENLDAIKLLITSKAKLNNSILEHLILNNKVTVFEYLRNELGEEVLLNALNIESALRTLKLYGVERQYFLEFLKSNGVDVNIPE
ncbi:ankyrin repeat domain-containing protein (plasmid) [Photobacterium damselae]|uniref:ankyrin repeat domain-containing protein n=1 Tax=Photobacterium damselae TaxID=38293 RepID=UPI002542FE35